MQSLALSSARGDADRVVKNAVQTLAEFRETKSTLWISYFLTTLARSFFQKGMFDQARSFVDQATIAVSNSGENWFLPENTVDIRGTSGKPRRRFGR